MTNYEKIKNMGIDQIARFLCYKDCGCLNCQYYSDAFSCSEKLRKLKEWLKSEVSISEGEQAND